MKKIIKKLKGGFKNFFKRPFSKRAKWSFVILGLLVLGFIFLIFFNGFYFYEEFNYENCNVIGISLNGDIYTYIPRDINGNNIDGYEDSVGSDDIVYYLQKAEEDPNFKAILIEVDSYGGVPVAGEEIAQAIKKTSKPVVAMIRQDGVSAAYWAISSADQIFASKNSNIGSIGATMSYLERVRKNEKEGLAYVQLNSGKYKDAGDSNKILTLEERELFMRDLKIIHQNFIKDVSDNRKIAIEKVKALADGSSVLGEKAQELGLIDKIGGIYEVKEYLGELINEKINICWR